MYLLVNLQKIKMIYFIKREKLHCQKKEQIVKNTLEQMKLIKKTRLTFLKN